MTDIFYITKVKKMIIEEFDLKAMIEMRDDLSQIIEASKPKPKWYIWPDVPKTRVYKRNALNVESEAFFDSMGYAKDRPWMCTGVPEDKRETCYKTWEDAMEWATMPSEKRIERLEYEAQFEMGQ